MEEKEFAVELQAEFTYEGEKQPALKTDRIQIPPGSCVVLCGGSGCGKTTLLRCINQLIPQFYDGALLGSGRIAGKELRGLSIGETGELAASVFQDPRSQFFTLNSSMEVAFGLENFGLPREEIRRRVQDAFSVFHLESLMNRDVFALSSGERQLVAIVAAWALDTDLILLDEPTANLDFHAISALSGLLRQMKDRGKTLLISEHRLCYLRDLADEYWLMDQGTIRRRFRREELLALPQQERERLGLRATDLGTLEPGLRKAPAPGGAAFCAREICFSYPHTGKQVLQNCSLTAHTGEVIGLIGPNGCGKTTFGKLAAGLLKPDGGTFTWKGVPVSGRELQSESIFIMQEAEFQFFTNSVWNELTYGRAPGEQDREEIRELLQSVGLWECRNRHPFSLSGGQMQKLVLLLAVLSPKPIVILDEPTAGLDYASLVSCAGLIRKMQERKVVLIVTHDLELMALVCTRCCAMEEGSAGRSFDLTVPGKFASLREYLEAMPGPPPSEPPPHPVRRRLDPRTKLLLFGLAMVAGIGTAAPVILLTYSVVMLVLLYERKWGPLAGGIASMGALYALYAWTPGVATAFLISFFPRMLVICFGAFLLAGKQEASRTLAALRRLRVPEGVILVASVTFRFFPVLRKDLKLMGQSIRTRGFFPGLSDKLRAIPQYLEVLVVPMVFRVIRIADALAASAETRGIARKNRRDSVIELRMSAADWLFAGLALLLFAAGLIFSMKGILL